MSLDKQDRKFKRVALTGETIDAALQTKGVAATLMRDSFFDLTLCHAVLKDISLGGAGALVPTEKKIPNKIKVLLANEISLRTKVVHRKLVSEKLEFLGLDWSRESDKKCRQVLKIVSALSHHEPASFSEYERNNKE